METLIKRTLSEKIQNHIYKGYLENKINDTEMVQITELMFDLLGLQTYSDAAKELDLSYNGIKKTNKIKRIKINNFKLVINNY